MVKVDYALVKSQTMLQHYLMHVKKIILLLFIFITNLMRFAHAFVMFSYFCE